MGGVTSAVNPLVTFLRSPIFAGILTHSRRDGTASHAPLDTPTGDTADCLFNRVPDERGGNMSTESTTFPDRELFIAGRWQAAGSGVRRDVIDPADGRVLTTVPEADAADVDVAVAAAREAFDSGPWPRMPGRDRA